MSWRFRKTFKVMPGVKLNLTRNGLSATVGAAPFSINVGPKGVYRNVSIPGTGLWDRERLDIPSSQHLDVEPPNRGGVPPPLLFPPPVPISPRGTEIRSASTELLTSESLEQLRRLLTDAYDERDVLAREIASANYELKSAKTRYEKWQHGFLMKRIRKQAFAARKEAFETSTAKLEELQEQLRQTILAMDISLDREQAEPYYRMRDDFASLSGCQMIWNVLTEQEIDRFRERSTSTMAVTRDSVTFSLDSCDLIHWEQKVPHLPNRTGGDMYIYPGFILYRASKQAFALIDSREVDLKFVSTQFTETLSIPSDAPVVGQTWAKANKDGSPDRRFNGNHQIPVVHYGELSFTSRDGLDVRYLCSNAALAKRIATTWAEFRSSLDHDGRTAVGPMLEGGGMLSEIQKFTAAMDSCKAACESYIQDLTVHWNETGTVMKADLVAFGAAMKEILHAIKSFAKVPGLPPTLKPSLRGQAKAFEEMVKGIDTLINTDYEQWRTSHQAFTIMLTAATDITESVTNFLTVVRQD